MQSAVVAAENGFFFGTYSGTDFNRKKSSAETEITVNEGDNIVYTTDGWDKLAATIDLSGYAQEEELERLVVGSLHRAVVEGDAETGTMHAGEVSSLIGEVKPTKAVIEDLISEAQSVLKNLDIL